jgi:hypothetical protein
MKPTAAPASADGQGASGLPERADALARRPSTKVVAPLWAVTVLAAMAGVALTLVARDNVAKGDLASNLALSVAVTAYATLGVLIVRRAGNIIGWIMLGAGAQPGSSRLS